MRGRARRDLGPPRQTTVGSPSRRRGLQTQGGKEDATARAFSIAQLGDEAQDVVIFGRDGEIEERRTFRPRI